MIFYRLKSIRETRPLISKLEGCEACYSPVALWGTYWPRDPSPSSLSLSNSLFHALAPTHAYEVIISLLSFIHLSHFDSSTIFYFGTSQHICSFFQKYQLKLGKISFLSLCLNKSSTISINKIFTSEGVFEK